MNETILIIEDEESICDILSYSLRNVGYKVHCAFTRQDGLRLFERCEPDLILLDLMLPDANGFDICKQLVNMSNVPILMLTARDDIVDKVLGLELGADDYMTKPFDIREVIARIKTALRRRVAPLATTILIHDYIRIEPASHTVFKDGEPVALKPKEYELLLLFARNKNQVFTREAALDAVWDMDYDGELRTIDVHVQRLRKKLDKPTRPSIIETVFGVGYKMIGD